MRQARIRLRPRTTADHGGFGMATKDTGGQRQASRRTEETEETDAAGDG